MSTVESPKATKANGSAGNGAGVPVANPATGQVIAHVPDMGAAEVRELVDRARGAQPAWEALGFDGRAEVMYETRRWMIENRDRVIQTLQDENGKAYEDASLELTYTADSLGFWAKKGPKYLEDERIRSHSPFMLGKKLVHRYRPYGVVGVIGPWNYPLANTFGDAIPALVAGNSVVMKPSEVTPLTSLLVAEGLRASGITEDACLVATGLGQTGAGLVDAADMIHFTGSVKTGKLIMARAAETLTPVSLELGGKDPMIVLKDADLERAANAAVHWGFANGGQICMSVERVYVEEPVHDEFVQKVVEKVRALRQGAPGGPGSVEVGAVTFPPQVEIIESHLKDALEKGAKVHTGGKRAASEGGDFFEPTVLTDVDHSMECMKEETFGPTLPIMKVSDAEEGLRLANDSPYGLNSSVWTKDVAKGEEIARRVGAGNVCVNDALMNYTAQELPFGGTGDSGIGERHGKRGIQKYCSGQSLLITRFAPKKEMYYMPYSPRTTKLLGRLQKLMYGRGAKKK